MDEIREGGEVIERLDERIIGRFAVGDIIDQQTGEVIVADDHEIDEDAADKIISLGIDKVRIRSVLTCKARHGVCQKCYGRNMATSYLVEIGEAVGTIAARSMENPVPVDHAPPSTGGVAIILVACLG